MSKMIRKMLSALVVLATLFAQINIPLSAETTTNEETTSIEETIDEHTENVEEEPEIELETYSEVTTFSYTPPSVPAGDPYTCALDGTMTFYQCFTDPAWADAVAVMVGKTDGNEFFTQTDADIVTEINGNIDVAPFIYTDGGGTTHMPKMDGLGLFTNLTKIVNFGTGGTSFGNVNWTDAGVTDFSRWSEATNLTDIQLINFRNSSLTTIDLSTWSFPSLINLRSIYFNHNQLTDIGDLGNWTMPSLTTVEGIAFNNNQLTDIGDLGNWTMPSLTTMSYLFFNNNQLTDIGDLGNWNFPSLTTMNSIYFNNNQLTDIGDLGNWTMPSLTSMSDIAFSYNQLTDIGDLGNWNFPSLTTMTDMYFNHNQLTDIGNLGNWTMPSLTTMGYLYFHYNQLTDIGDLENWTMPSLTVMREIYFNNNQLTDIGDLGNWHLPSLTMMDSIRFNNNQLTNIGDLGNWNFPSLTTMSQIYFQNNQLTNIGDLSSWGTNFPLLTTFGGISFQNNRLTNIGNLANWINMPATIGYVNVYGATEPVNFSNNQLTDVPFNDALTSAKNAYANFSNQKTIAQNTKYFNRYGMSNGTNATIVMDAYNGMNSTSGSEGVYDGSYTLTPDVKENYTNSHGLNLTGVANSIASPYTMTVPFNIGDVNATYTVTQHQGWTNAANSWSNTDTTPRVWYSAEVVMPLSYMELDIDANNFSIALGNVGSLASASAIGNASATVYLKDEFGVVSVPTPTVNAAELAAIQGASATGTYPLTFTYTYTGAHGSVTVSETVTVTVTNAPVTYGVTYNANGADSGTVPTDSGTYVSGANVTVLGNSGTLGKVGYTFDGWNTQPNGSGTNYVAGATFNISANTTLYAKWLGNQQTVTWDYNGGTDSSSLGSLVETTVWRTGDSITASYATNISTAIIAPTGKVFGGWTGGVFPYTVPNAATTFTAVWYDDSDGTTLGLNADNITMRLSDYNSMLSVDELAGATLGNPVQYDIPAHTPSTLQPTFTTTTTAGSIGSAVAGSYTVTFTANGLTVTKTLYLTDYDDENATHGIKAQDVTMTVADYNALTSINALVPLGNPVQYDITTHTPSNPQPTFNTTTSAPSPLSNTAVAGQYTLTFSANSLTSNRTLTLYDDTDNTTLGLNANHVVMTVAQYNAMIAVDDLAGATLGNPVQYDIPAHTPSSPQPAFTTTTTAGAIGSATSGNYQVTFSANGLSVTKDLVLYDDTDGTTLGLNANHVTMRIDEYDALTSINDLIGAIYGNPVQYDIPAHTASSPQPTFTVTTSAPAIGSGAMGVYTLGFSANGLTANKTLTLTPYDDENATTGIKANHVTMTVDQYNTLTTLDDLTQAVYGNPEQYDIPAHTLSVPQPTFTVATDAASIGSGVSGTYNLSFSASGLTAHKTLTLYDDTDGTTKGLNADHVTMRVSDFDALTTLDDLAIYANATHYDLPAHTVTVPQPTFTVGVTGVTIGSGVTGVYPMVVSANGLHANKTLTLLGAPTIEVVHPGTNSQVCGNAEPGYTVIITLPNGSQETTVADSTGRWCITSPIELFPGETVTAEQTDGSGVISDQANTIVTPYPPTIDPVHPGTNPDVCGQGEPGYDVTVTFPDGSQANVTVAADGTWCVISPIELFPGDNVEAEQTDSAGNTSEPADTIVTPYPPTIDPVHPGTNPDVCGQGEPGYIVTVTFPDGSQATVTVAADGTWCVVSPIELEPGDNVEAEQTDPAGNTSEPADTIVTPYPPTIDPINPGVDVCGQGEPGYIVTVTFPDGSQANVTVATDGTWCVVSPIPLEPGDEVEAEQTDPDGNTSEKETETVRPNPPTIDPINPGENPDVCGQGEPGYTITVTFPDGSQATATVAADGTWCVVSPIELEPGDEVDAEQTDPDGNTSEKETETVTPYPPTIDPINPGVDVCGQGEPGYIVTVTFPDGSQANVTVAADGTWCVVSPIPLEPGDEVDAEQTDPDGNTSEKETEIVRPNPPTIDPINPGENPDVCGQGEPGYTITVTFPDGSQATVTVAADGTWCVVSPIPLEPGDEVDAEQTDPDGNTSEKETETVTPYPPTIDPIKPGETPDVCGQGEPGYTITVTFPDGSQATVTVAADGTWCVVSPIDLEEGDEVEAEQTDPDGNTSLPETEIVSALNFVIDANNISMHINDYNEYLTSGVLEDKILYHSEARAYETTTNTEITNIAVDASNLTTGTVAVGDVHDVTLTINNEISTSSTLSYATDNDIQNFATNETARVIQVTIIGDTGLPTTGESIREILFISLIIGMISFILLLAVRYWRMRKEA